MNSIFAQNRTIREDAEPPATVIEAAKSSIREIGKTIDLRHRKRMYRNDGLYNSFTIPLSIALSWPHSEFSKKFVPALLTEYEKSDPQGILLSRELGSFIIRNFDTFAPFSEQPEVNKRLAKMKRMGPGGSSQLLYGLSDDKQLAITRIVQTIKKRYLSESKRRDRHGKEVSLIRGMSWGPDVDFLISVDPNNPYLNEFTKLLSKSDLPSKDFIVWMTNIKRGLSAGEFPHDSYYQLWRSRAMNQILLSIAKDKKFLRYYSLFNDPYILLGQFGEGFAKTDVSGKRSRFATMAAFLARTQWICKGLPYDIDSELVYVINNEL